jgi:hypothetical protein
MPMISDTVGISSIHGGEDVKMAMLATASPGDFVEHAKVLKDLLGAALNTLSA